MVHMESDTAILSAAKQWVSANPEKTALPSPTSPPTSSFVLASCMMTQRLLSVGLLRLVLLLAFIGEEFWSRIYAPEETPY
ncbi:unnamed protein product [Darwinula stevensoni]|uniref:Uncharacterized protein n=1 Tax=Darwinula stevensoni TaxID=69355 RepID=A0A7R9A289_9CRUS|nr:unnamed protein product [Darwinula stevensoni]CAG0879019.1 unnamed protein product [Darwinula stevensoni]